MTALLPIRPTHDGIFIDIVDRDVTHKDLGNGKVLHLLADDNFGSAHNPMMGKHPGQRPRWARVWAVGPEADDVVQPGDLVLCDELKWGRKISLGRIGLTTVYFWRIAAGDIMVVDERGPDHEAYLEGVREQFSRMEYNIGKL